MRAPSTISADIRHLFKTDKKAYRRLYMQRYRAADPGMVEVERTKARERARRKRREPQHGDSK